MARLKVTDDEYELLTEEERVGLKEFQAELEAEAAAEDAEIAAAAAGEPEVEDKPAKEKKPAKEEPPAEEEGDDDEDEGEDDEAGEGEPEEGEEGEEGAGEGEEEGDEDQPPAAAAAAASDHIALPSPPPAQRMTEAEEKRLVAIKGELKALAQKFDDGDITAVEWRDKQEALEDERDALKEKKSLAAMSVQTAVNTWYYTTIPTFMAQHPEYKEGSLRHKLLDTVVRELQTGADNPTDPKILFDAHAKVVAEFGAGEPAEPKKKKAVNGNGKGRKSPPNFSKMPASDQQQVTPPNKFARLDKLKGVEYERALAKLTPADRDFYLQGG